MSSSIIRKGIALALYKDFTPNDPAISNYTTKRWGAESAVTKSVVNPLLATQGGPLVPEKLVRDEFIQAVFSNSILGRLQGLIEVPELTHVNVETTPVLAVFVAEYQNSPASMGAFDVRMTGKRRISTTAVFSDELLRMSNHAAEGVVFGQLQRALSRGVDAAFMGAQARDTVSPTGLAAIAVQVAPVTMSDTTGLTVVNKQESFNAGVAAFTGALNTASVLVNPLTAISLRSPTEQGITANGGTYGGLPVITSYGVPVNRLFIVDGSRVVAFLGSADIKLSTEASITMPIGSSTGSIHLFQSGNIAMQGDQYVDWDFAPGAAVEVTLSLS